MRIKTHGPLFGVIFLLLFYLCFMYISYCACKQTRQNVRFTLSLRFHAAAAIAIAVAVGSAEPGRQVDQAVGPQVDALGRGDGAAVVARADAFLCVVCCLCLWWGREVSLDPSLTDVSPHKKRHRAPPKQAKAAPHKKRH
jgi:hypothetical protein